jgi:hypothetical protein
MAKHNTNGTETHAVIAAPEFTPTIHLILQGKGSVGKSIVASWLAEFLIGRGQPVRCFDGDPVNRSLGQTEALNVEKLDLLNDEGVVMRSRYDALINRFLTEEAVFLVDNGATAFLPFWTFIVESDVISTLRAAGRDVEIKSLENRAFAKRGLFAKFILFAPPGVRGVPFTRSRDRDVIGEMT